MNIETVARTRTVVALTTRFEGRPILPSRRPLYGVW